MRKLRLLALALLLLIAPAVFAQGQMTVHYSYSYSGLYNAAGTIFYSNYVITGYTVCGGGTCPNNAHHSGTINNHIGTVGGTSSGIDSVPAQNQLYASYDIQTNAPNTVDVLTTIGGEIVCTVVGIISSD